MTLDDLHFLLSVDGERWLVETADPPITPKNHLQIASRLRQHLPPAQAQAVLETTLLRQLAAAKFSRAAKMFFERAALEQASSEVVSMYRARRFIQAGFELVADLGCGIGGDSIALAAQAAVVGVERDPVRLAMARENVRVYGRACRFQPLQADLLALPPLPVPAVFFDPARRDEAGRRLYSVHNYRPPLRIIDGWREKMGNTAVKISPGVDYAELPGDAEWEFISVKGEVKEGVLWSGDLHSGARRRATLLPGGHTLTDAQLPADAIPIVSPKAYLFEPDKAIIRAHLVEALAVQLGAAKISSDIAYLTANSPTLTPLARCYAVEAVFPFQLKRLRQYLRQHDIGQVTIKKRGSPLEIDALQRQLRLRGSQRRILFLTQTGGEAAVIVGQALSDEK